MPRFCFTLPGTAMLPMTANAAATQKKFTVEETVKIDGQNVTAKAVVSYGYVVHSKVTINGGTRSALYAESGTVTITADSTPEGKYFSG